MDPFGFVLEALDVQGAPRTTWNGTPIDTSVNIDIAGLTLKGSFAGSADFERALASSSDYSRCMTGGFLVYLSGESGSRLSNAGTCAEAPKDPNASFVDVAAAYYASDAFLLRK